MALKLSSLTPRQYYVISLPRGTANKSLHELLLVRFESYKRYVERDDGRSGGETKYIFTMVRELNACDEGLPQIGEEIRMNDKEWRDLEKAGATIKECSVTEQVLYGNK